MLPLLLLSQALAAPCAGPRAAASSVEASLGQAEAAWADLDVERFNAAMDAAAIALPCVDAPLSPAFAARYHTDRGLQLYAAGQPDAARAAFAAAQRADGSAQLSDRLLPEGHEGRALWSEARALPSRDEPLPAPEAGRLWLDGAAATQRPAGHATLAQHLPPSGPPSFTAWLAPGEALPFYALAPEAERPVGGLPDAPPPKSSKAAGTFGGVAAVSGLAAVGLYGAAFASRLQYEQGDPTWTRDDLEAARGRTNLLTTAAGGAAAVGVVAGLGFVVAR